MSDLGDSGKRALHAIRAERNAETKLRIQAERKYADLLAGIAKAVVIELRAAHYIEVHTELLDTKGTP